MGFPPTAPLKYTMVPPWIKECVTKKELDTTSGRDQLGTQERTYDRPCVYMEGLCAVDQPSWDNPFASGSI